MKFRKTKNRIYRKKRSYRKKSIKDRVPRRDPRRYADITWSPTNLADRTMVKLKYMERIVFTSTAGVQSSQVFRGNSLFDPNQTGTGQQPLGFDEWCNFYANYRVKGAKINVQYVSPSSTTSATQTWDVALYPALVTTIADQASAKVQPLVKYRMGNLGSNTIRLSSYVSTSKMFGTNKKAIDINDDYGALINTNPVNVWFFNMCCQPCDQSTSGSIVAYVTITYYAEFYNKKTLALS